MYLSHFAVGFASKRVAPAISLGTLFLACQLADVIWPTLVLLGIEHVAISPGITAVTPLDFQSYPYSHSLLALAVWAVLVASIYRIVRREGSPRSMVLLGVLVLSHWVLDVVSHRPDMPLAPGVATRLGLELWRSVPATMAVEAGMLAAGVWLYVRATQPRDRTGTYALWGLVVFFGVTYLAAVFGPPPPSAAAVAWSAEAVWLIVLWGSWVDRHRSARVTA